jgi:hypothetical protein
MGRGQIELLAALLHADAPNDLAPSAYNDEDPPGVLPASPLAPRPADTGFRGAAYTRTTTRAGRVGGSSDRNSRTAPARVQNGHSIRSSSDRPARRSEGTQASPWQPGSSGPGSGTRAARNRPEADPLAARRTALGAV